MNAFRVVLFAGLSMLLWSSPPLWAADFEIDNYTLVSSARVTRTVYEYTYKADVGNWSGTDANITVTVTSTVPHIVVVENSLSFGDVPDGATAGSADTFIVRHDRSKPFDTAALVWTVNAAPLPPTTFALIDKALTAGIINAETALIYKVYDSFGDERLPLEFRGRDDGFIDNPVISTVQAQFDSLSPQTQTLLAPFLKPADEPGSWQELQILGQVAPLASSPSSSGQALIVAAAAPALQWQPVPTANGRVIVWWLPQRPQDEARARAFANELDNYLWAKLAVPFRAPRPDVVSLNPNGPATYHGNDSRLDILLTTRNRAETYPPTVCNGNPVGAVIELTPRSGKEELAHELMHAILYGYPTSVCPGGEFELRWMAEATATWAMQFAYPQSNLEHGGVFNGRPYKGAKDFLKDPTIPLNRRNDSREYGAYLWFFRLAGQGNDPTIVNATWNAAYDKSSLDAIESVLQGFGFGGFDKQWPQFVLDNWNRVAAQGKPYRDYYRWDKLKHQAKEEFPVKPSLQGQAHQQEPIQYFLGRLSATYRRYDFTADPNIRGVLFENADAGNKPTASIQAIVKVKGKDWQLAEDWSNDKEKFFCRDKAEEDIEELVLVIANRGFRTSDPATIEDLGNFNLFYSGLPCHDWTGNVTYRSEFTGFPGATDVLTAEGANLRFRVDLTQNLALWNTIEGVVTWNHVVVTPYGAGSSCTSTSSGSFAAKDKGQFFLNFFTGSAPQFSGTYLAYVPSPPTVAATFICTGPAFGGTFSYTVDGPFFGVPWFDTGPTPWPLNLGATAIQGNYSAPSIGNLTEQWTWDLSKAP